MSVADATEEKPFQGPLNVLPPAAMVDPACESRTVRVNSTPIIFGFSARYDRMVLSDITTSTTPPTYIKFLILLVWM